MSLYQDVETTLGDFKDHDNTPENISKMLSSVQEMDGITRASYKAGRLEVETTELKVMRSYSVPFRNVPPEEEA